MQILLIYATYSSGTDVASSYVEDILKQHHVSVARKDVRDVQSDELDQYDLIILASPSWLNRSMDGMPHEHMLAFMDTMQGKTFPGKKFAVLGLGDTAYPKFCGAVDHLIAFVESMQGTLIIEPLRIDGFFFNQKENTKLLMEWAVNLAKVMNH